MFKTIKKTYKTLLVASSFALVGCGGGGSGSSLPSGANLPTKPDSSKMAKLDNDNASQSILYVYQSVSDSTDVDLNKMERALSSNRIISSNKKLKRSEKKYNVSDKCDSGKAAIDAEDESSGTLKYDNCSIDGFVYNGEIVFSENDYEEPIFEYKNLTVDNENLNIHINIKYMYQLNSGATTIIKNTYATYNVAGNVLKYFNYSSEEGLGVLKFKGYIKPVCMSGYIYAESKDKLVDKNYDNGEPDIDGTFLIKSGSKTASLDIDKDLIYVTLPNKKTEVFKYNDIIDALSAQSCSVSIKPTVPYRPKSDNFIDLSDNNVDYLKVGRAMYNASNLVIDRDFPQLNKILSDLDYALECVSGDVRRQDNNDKIYATYKNCEISSGVVYNGDIAFELSDNNISNIVLNNLEIKHNNITTKIKYAKAYKTFKENYNDDEALETHIHIENMYANINQNEYLNFNFLSILNTTEKYDKNDKEYSGYIKTSCLGKFAHIEAGAMFYNSDNIIELGRLEIEDGYINESEYIYNDNMVIDFDSYEDNTVEFRINGDDKPTMTIEDFLQDCK